MNKLLVILILSTFSVTAQKSFVMRDSLYSLMNISLKLQKRPIMYYYNESNFMNGLVTNKLVINGLDIEKALNGLIATGTGTITISTSNKCPYNCKNCKKLNKR